MNHHRPGSLFVLLTLAILFLAACQPAAPEPSNLPNEPALTATQPSEVGTEAPASEPTEAVSQAAPTTEGSALPPTDVQAPDGWQVLNYTTQGYSLAFPPVWEACQKTQYSWSFCEIQEEPEGMGPPPRLYVSVFPQDYTNPDWEVYNYIPTETIREFMALPVGESMLKPPGSPLPEYLTYTRLPDRMVAGWTAAVIENSKVWEAPPETKERVAFILTEDTTYMIGTYYETPEQLAMFEQVLDSFQFGR